jgi:S-adenosylmethionine-diacylglycerol 3-amino-3-carboxypropyl transferase
LFNSTDIIEQKRIWTEEWDTPFWKTFLRVISPRIIWRLFFRDPGFYKYVPGKWYIYKYIHDRFNSAVEHFLLKESPFATLLFFGKYTNHDVLPIYLRRGDFDMIRDNLERIEIVTESLNSYLAKVKRNRFSKFSLSDFNSYLTNEDYVYCWRYILENAVSGALICERQWLVKREVPGEFQKYIDRKTGLEAALQLSDDSIFYTFNVARKL